MGKIKQKAAEIDERVRRVLWDCHTWGKLEAAAGVSDRHAFWKGKSEGQARAELHRLVAERVARGEV